MKISFFYRVSFLLLITLFLHSHEAHARTLRPESAGDQWLITVLVARVRIMRAVAYDKWMQRKPIKDKKREAEVLKAAQADAKKFGITKIEPLILAQIEIAKAEQRRWHARWDKRGMDIKTAPDLATSRRELDRLGKELLPALKIFLPLLRDSN